MERIEGDVRRELERFGAVGDMPAVVDSWVAAVGEEIARNAWPARISRDGVLHVNTSSSTWAFELTQLAPSIAARLTEQLGDAAPTGVRFVSGPIPEPLAERPERASPERPPPSADDLAEAQRLASVIGDEELREQVAKAAAMSLREARSDRRFW